MAAIQTAAVNHVALTVTDKERAREFYTNVLSFQFLIEDATMRQRGTIVRPRGEGDSRFAVFARATDAIAAACEIQRSLFVEAWPTPIPLRVRIALHTGEADLREGDYYGTAVNRCARLRSAAHGGQTLVSQTSFDLVHDALPEGITLRDLGEHRLKDLQRP